MNLHDYVVRFCAPTLANIKTAGLFSYGYVNEWQMAKQLEKINQCLNAKGITIVMLRRKWNNALIYVYRNSWLSHDLENEMVKDYLSTLGYNTENLEACIQKLAARCMDTRDFPHEIGLFLGYPLKDVMGFIHNGGKNYITTGYWKVYHDLHQAQRLFARYKKCYTIYNRLFLNGRTISQLTVSA